MSKKRTESNPKKCPICKTLSEWRLQAGGWHCPKCKQWFFPSDLSDSQLRSYTKGHKNPGTKQTKVLGFPVMMVAIVGGLAWWLTRKQ